MSLTRLAYLYEQYQAQRLTGSEREEWESMVMDASYNEAIQQLITADWVNADKANEVDSQNDGKQEQIYRFIISQQQNRDKRLRMHKLLPYAAAVLCMAIAGYWFTGKRVGTGELPQQAVQTEIVPGGNKAVLTLPDGRAVDLSANHSGIVMAENEIKYFNGDEVVDQAGNAGPDNGEPGMLTLTIPIGGTYQLTLPDGSNVWVNAGSTLRYPSKFDEQRRAVELTGEAYFEVAKDPNRPFRVVTAGQHIDVLGTQFNISAYRNEPTIKTTLVEGSVRVTNTKAGFGDTLKPGQQSVATNEGTQIIEVATAQFTAWKDGYFRFESTPFPEVLEQLARWYDVEIEYRQKPSKTFSGTMKRDVQLASILEFFKNSGIQSRIDGRKLIIEQQKALNEGGGRYAPIINR